MSQKQNKTTTTKYSEEIEHKRRVRVAIETFSTPCIPYELSYKHIQNYSHPLISNSLSNVQITSTNIQRYYTVQNRFLNRFGETTATARHDNF